MFGHKTLQPIRDSNRTTKHPPAGSDYNP